MSLPRALALVLVSVLMLAVSSFAAPAAQAQGFSIPGMGGGGGSVGSGESGSQSTDPQALRDSLDRVIATLENEARRSELLTQLKELRTATGSVAGDAGGADMPQQGLLGALADSLSDFDAKAKAGQSPLDIWARRSRNAFEDLEALFTSTTRIGVLRNLAEAGILLGVWFALLSLLIGAGRLLAKRRDWPLVLPPEPRAGLLIAHFLRKVLPWAVAFAVMLASLRELAVPEAARAMVLVIAYITLCGRLLSSVFDVVISLFTRGHRRVAVTILRRQALRRLFVIGALAALGDAVNSDQLTALLGDDLAGWLAVSASVLAGLISGRLVLRIKRPVKHLIRNRPYAQRRDTNGARELTRLLARLWHVPALLLIGASLAAILITVGDAGDAFAKALICAALLVLTLVINGVLHRHSETAADRKRKSQYRQRLERFGYTLTHCVFWVIFAELSLRVWGASLLGIGEGGAISARIGHALLGIGLTVLLAWLVWIFADTAIQRTLNVSAKSRGRRVHSTRAQTITPLIRNVIFYTIVVIAAIVGLANLGVNVTPLLAGAGVIGLAIGFGAQTLVQDLITGLFILIEDSLSIDDFVDVGGHMGTVEKLSLRTVRLRDLDGIVHIIPFSQIKGIQNYSREYGTALLRIRVPHAMKIDDAIDVVREVADELRQDPMMRHHIWSPLELQGIESFDQGAAIMRVRMRTGPVMQWDVARAFNLRLKQRLDSDGTEMAMPRLSVVLENPPVEKKTEIREDTLDSISRRGDGDAAAT